MTVCLYFPRMRHVSSSSQLEASCFFSFLLATCLENQLLGQLLVEASGFFVLGGDVPRVLGDDAARVAVVFVFF